MRFIFLTTIVLISICQPQLIAQDQSTKKLYKHKVTVDSILQTKAYTYLKVTEKFKEKDSVQWMAIPLFEPKVGDIYYFDNGLQMGMFLSKELNRTFENILFLASLGTTPEVSGKNIVPVPVIDTVSQNTPPAEVHTVVVKEVVQAGSYTYLRVKEGDKEDWLAVVKKNASVGQTYTYDDAAPMTDFTSQELKRTFKKVLFIAKLTLSIDSKNESSSKSDSKKKNKTEKKDIKPGPAQEVSSIAILLENKKSYSGKMILIKGEVTKYSSTILGKNWIHIKDGTSFLGKSDLTITTDQEFKVGDKATFEGVISLDKDFGSGYFFDVIMEDAKVQSK